MPIPTQVTKISHTLARDKAYATFRDWIIEGTLQPGEIIRDQELAEALGISRTPVREAIRRLEDEGLIEIAKNRWTRVAPIYAEDADDLYQVVKTLEVSALELAWHSLGKAALEQLEVSNDVMKQAVEQHDALQALRADNEFHEVWIRESGNRELARILRDVKAKIRRIEIRYFNSEDAACSVDEHARIIQALGKQKREEAVILLQENWAADTGRLVKRPPIGSESV